MQNERPVRAELVQRDQNEVATPQTVCVMSIFARLLGKICVIHSAVSFCELRSKVSIVFLLQRTKRKRFLRRGREIVDEKKGDCETDGN